MRTTRHSTPRIYVKGQPLATEHFVYNDMTYVPLRAVAEGLNMDVQWDSQNHTIDINKNSIVQTDLKYPEHISLINLIATPEKYHGKYIELEGYYYIVDFEGSGLFLTYEYARQYVAKNSVYVNFNESDYRNFEKYNDIHFAEEAVLVRIEGIYNKNGGYPDSQCGSVDDARITGVYP